MVGALALRFLNMVPQVFHRTGARASIMSKYIYFVLLLGFFFVPNESKAALLYASSSESHAVGSGSGINVNNATFSGTVRAFVINAFYIDSMDEMVQFRLRDGSNVPTDCYTENKLMSDWGMRSADISDFDNPNVLDLQVFPVSGSGCTVSYSNATGLLADMVINRSGFRAGFVATSTLIAPLYIYDSVPSSTSTPSLDITTDTRFTGIDITGTSTVNVNADWNIASNEIETGNPARYISTIRYSTSIRPSTTLSTQSELTYEATGVGSTTTSYSGLSDGTYDLLVTFGNASTPFSGVIPFANAYAYSWFTITSGVLTATGTSEFFNGLTSPYEDAYVYQQCSITQISGCINNSFVFLFVPNQEFVQEHYLDLQNTLDSHLPFSYITDLSDVFEQFASTTGSTTPPSINLTLLPGNTVNLMQNSTSTISDNIRNGLRTLASAVMYTALGFAFWATRGRIFG